jgi:GTPase SAR1 family protein
LEHNINNPVASQPVSAAASQKDAPKGKSKGQVPKEQGQQYLKASIWDTAGQETYKSITRYESEENNLQYV